MTAFFAGLDGYDITAIVLGSWLILAALIAPRMGRAMRHDEEVRQPEVRDWLCSDGFYRTEAEAADWTLTQDGAWARLAYDEADADWLPGWVNDHDTVPDYVPREWVA